MSLIGQGRVHLLYVLFFSMINLTRRIFCGEQHIQAWLCCIMGQLLVVVKTLPRFQYFDKNNRRNKICKLSKQQRRSRAKAAELISYFAYRCFQANIMAFLASKSNPACIRSPHPIYIEVLQTITIFKPCHAQNLWQKIFSKLAMQKIENGMSIYNLLQLMQIWLNLPLDFNVLMVSAFNSNYFCQKKVKFSAIPTKNHRVKQTKFILPNPVSSGK